MTPAPFEYLRVASVREAISTLGAGEVGARLLAGGHSLIPQMKLRRVQPSLLVDIGGLSELSYIEERGDEVAIGALTRHHDIEASGLLRREVPVLSFAASLVGDPQVRHRGTIGGSLAHGDPASDLSAVAMALEAAVVARSPRGERTISVRDLFVDYLETKVEHDEILTEIRVPRVPGAGWSYQKFKRRAQDWALVGVAVVRRPASTDGPRTTVALANMGSTTLRATRVEEALARRGSAEDAARLASDGTGPRTRGNAETAYRRHLSQVLTYRALMEAGG